MSERSFTTTFKTAYESQAISKYQEDLKRLQKSIQENKAEQRALSKEVKNAEKEIARINKQIEKTGETTDQQEKDLERLNKTVKDGKDAIEALKLQESQLQTQINETNKKIEDERKALEQLKTSIANAKKYGAELVKEFGALGAAATAAVAGLFAFTRDSAQWADQLNTLSKTTGIGTSELQKFAYASDLIDVSVETMTGSLTKLTRNMQSASENGTSAAAKAFEQLGISVTDASGQLRDRQQVFYEIIDALGRIENVTERDAISMNVFGRSAQELNPLIMGGTQTLKQLGDEAERAGLILDQTTLNGLNEFNNKIDLLKAKGTQIKNLAASEMTPALEGLLEVGDELLNEIKEMAKSGELKKMAKDAGKIIKDGATALKNLIEFVWKYKEAIGAVVVGMVAFKVSLSITGVINSLVIGFKALKVATDSETTSMGALNTVMAANPIGLVLAAVSALTMGVLALTSATSTQTGELKNTTVEVKDYTEALKSAQAQEEKIISAAEGEAEVLKTQRDEYDRLRSKTHLTADEKKQLEAVASKLATTLGTTTEALKDQSGAYRDVSASVDEYIRNLQNRAKAEHLESIIKESTAAMFDLEEPIENAKSKIAEIEGKIAEFAEETRKHDAEWNKAHESEREQLKKTYKEAQQTYAQLEAQRRDALLAQQRATDEYKKLPPIVNRAASSVEAYAENLKDLKSASTSLRSEMSSLASSYDQLNNGQSLSVDTILNLIEKYPEYTDLLIEAATNTDLQRAAVETLFEAKKNEYILTQQAAIDNIRASNLEKDVFIRNIDGKITKLNEYAEALSLSTDDARKEKFYQRKATELNLLRQKRIEALNYGDDEQTERLQRNIDFVNGLTIDTYKGGSSGSTKTSGSSSKSSGSSGDKALWEMNSQGVYASGDTYLRAYEGWIDRMKNLGKMSTSWEIKLLEELLRRSENTADERYELEYRLYKAKEELATQEAKAQEEAARKQQERLLERQNLALAAFKKLSDDKIAAYAKEADAAKKAADAEIKAIDDIENRRKQQQDDAKRQAELDRINAQLKYDGHNLTTPERVDLERRRQDILNEQYEEAHARSVEAQKAAILSRSEAIQDRSQQAIEGLQAAKTGLSDHLAAVWGTQTYDQRVANNSRVVNVQLISQGLTEDQAAKRIAAKVIKELG